MWLPPQQVRAHVHAHAHTGLLLWRDAGVANGWLSTAGTSLTLDRPPPPALPHARHRTAARWNTFRCWAPSSACRPSQTRVRRRCCRVRVWTVTLNDVYSTELVVCVAPPHVWCSACSHLNPTPMSPPLVFLRPRLPCSPDWAGAAASARRWSAVLQQPLCVGVGWGPGQACGRRGNPQVASKVEKRGIPSSRDLDLCRAPASPEPCCQVRPPAPLPTPFSCLVSLDAASRRPDDLRQSMSSLQAGAAALRGSLHSLVMLFLKSQVCWVGGGWGWGGKGGVGGWVGVGVGVGLGVCGGGGGGAGGRCQQVQSGAMVLVLSFRISPEVYRRSMAWSSMFFPSELATAPTNQRLPRLNQNPTALSLPRFTLPPSTPTPHPPHPTPSIPPPHTHHTHHTHTPPPPPPPHPHPHPQDTREAALNWLAAALNSNGERIKMRPDAKKACTDGFALNLAGVSTANGAGPREWCVNDWLVGWWSCTESGSWPAVPLRARDR